MSNLLTAEKIREIVDHLTAQMQAADAPLSIYRTESGPVVWYADSQWIPRDQVVLMAELLDRWGAIITPAMMMMHGSTFAELQAATPMVTWRHLRDYYDRGRK